MNRRSFFASLGLLAAGAAVAPSVFIQKFEPVRWKPARVLRLNPEWVTAPFEIVFVDQPLVCDQAIFHRGTDDLYGYLRERYRMEHYFPPRDYPARFTIENGKYKYILPFL